MNIDEWLKTFKEAWIAHDVDRVMSLFAADVEYWETPQKKVSSLAELKSEWQVIKLQKDIKLGTELFSSANNSHSVIWRLEYSDDKGVVNKWSGTYLIKLNTQGLCIYFHHTGEIE